jgi:outer membrane biosynthesis protein TonB
MRNVLSMLTIAVISMAAAGNTDPIARADHDQQHPDLRLVHADVPMYPQMARLARVSGIVEVQVTINNGLVAKTEVKSGAGVLANATEENIKSWRFQESVNTTLTVKFIYQLDKRKPSYGQNPRVELELPFKVTITSAPIQGD